MNSHSTVRGVRNYLGKLCSIRTMLTVFVVLQVANANASSAGPHYKGDESPLRAATAAGYYEQDGKAYRNEIELVRLPLLGALDGFGLRRSHADRGFRDLNQQAAFLDFRLPFSWEIRGRYLVQPRLTLEAGHVMHGAYKRLFGSIGPSFRFSSLDPGKRWFTDVGLSPTAINGASFGDDDFGTPFNFTTFVGRGRRFGSDANLEIRIRYQHISNGGINHTNPGTNMAGIDFTFRRR